MREVIYKNLTSLKGRKKDIFLREIFEKDGVIAKTERRCFYFIKEITHIDGNQEFKHWIEQRKGGDLADKRRFHIFKRHNDCLGEDKLICKVAGTFYTISDSSVYTVAFLHSFKVTFVRADA